MQFIVNATNLYKQMVERQDAILHLLKNVSGSRIKSENHKFDQDEERESIYKNANKKVYYESLSVNLLKKKLEFSEIPVDDIKLCEQIVEEKTGNG
jgi:dephospho-CoA kinase